MDINFDAETPEGTVNFKGTLTQEEVSFLLKYAILSLMARGTLPVSIEESEADGEIVPLSLN